MDKQALELAQTIANQAQALADGKIPPSQIAGQARLILSNAETLREWTKPKATPLPH